MLTMIVCAVMGLENGRFLRLQCHQTAQRIAGAFRAVGFQCFTQHEQQDNGHRFSGGADEQGADGCNRHQ